MKEAKGGKHKYSICNASFTDRAELEIHTGKEHQGRVTWKSHKGFSDRIMGKNSDLAEIAKDVAKLKKHFDLATKPVPGEGNPDAELMIIGEAPGQIEDGAGRPFMGRAGRLLEKLLLMEIGIDRKDIFITNTVKFYPDQKAPSQKEIDLCLPYTLKQIDIVEPKVVLLLGSIAIRALTKWQTWLW